MEFTDTEFNEFLNDLRQNNLNRPLNERDNSRIRTLQDVLMYTNDRRRDDTQFIDVSNYINILTSNERYISKFCYYGYHYEIGFKNLPQDLQILNDITYACIDFALKKSFNKAKKNDMVRIVIEHPSIATQPISLPYMLRDELTTEMILTAIALVAQSKKELKFDEFMKISTGRIDFPSGTGSNDLIKYIARRRSIIKIKNVDSFCLLRAIVVGIAFCEHKSDPMDKEKHAYYKKIYRHGSNEQTRRTNELRLALNIITGPLGLPDIKKIVEYLEEYQIYVFSDESNLFKIIYKSENEKDKKIYLLYHDSHFDLLTSVPAFFKARHNCDICGLIYKYHYEKHKCNNVCKICKKIECIENPSTEIKCDWCRVKCRNNTCLSIHREYCQNQKKCDTCGCFTYKNHICNGRYCGNCKINVDKSHQCFISVL